MARNQEKAQSMLYRFRQAQMAELGLSQHGVHRPPHTAMATSVADADKWRSQVVREITRKVSRIHDPGLTDAQIRQVNDDINSLLKEKWRWERRIQELGGPDWSKLASQSDPQGKEMFGVKGYKYFGRAKELPEVKDYFDKLVSSSSSTTTTTKPSKMADRAHLDAEYFGYLPPPDVADQLAPLQSDLVTKLLHQLGPMPTADELYADDPVGQILASSADVLRLPYLPSLADVERHLVDQRKRRILASLPVVSTTSPTTAGQCT